MKQHVGNMPPQTRLEAVWVRWGGMWGIHHLRLGWKVHKQDGGVQSKEKEDTEWGSMWATHRLRLAPQLQNK